MKQLTGNQIRQMFLDYFKSKGHMIEPGASLIPHIIVDQCGCCGFEEIF